MFLKGKIGDDWVCLDGFMKKPDGQMAHRPLMFGRSIIGRFLDEIEYRKSHHVAGLSPEVRDQACSPDADPRIERSFYCIDTEFPHVSKGKYEHERCVLKEAMNAFENGELDEIHHRITEVEHAQLEAEDSQRYTFYRRDNPCGAFAIKRRLMDAHASKPIALDELEQTLLRLQLSTKENDADKKKVVNRPDPRFLTR